MTRLRTAGINNFLFNQNLPDHVEGREREGDRETKKKVNKYSGECDVC